MWWIGNIGVCGFQFTVYQDNLIFVGQTQNAGLYVKWTAINLQSVVCTDVMTVEQAELMKMMSGGLEIGLELEIS